MKKYKKKVNISSNVLATARILCTVLLLCLAAYITFVIIFRGWSSLVAWFQGKWMVFACLIALVIVTGGLWLYNLYKRLKGFRDDGKQ